MSEGTLRLQCRGCDTVYDVCNLPTDVIEVVKKVRSVKCPQCANSSSKADIYMGEEHETEGT